MEALPRLRSEHRIVSTLEAQQLWDLARGGFEDSETSELWPRQLERVSCPELKAGARVTARYEILGPFGATQTYRVTAYAPPRLIAYETGASHPLRGGGELVIEPRPEGGSELVWSLRYRVRPRPTSLLGLAFVRYLFVPRFFAALEANLRAVEARRRPEGGSAVPGLREALSGRRA